MKIWMKTNSKMINPLPRQAKYNIELVFLGHRAFPTSENPKGRKINTPAKTIDTAPVTRRCTVSMVIKLTRGLSTLVFKSAAMDGFINDLGSGFSRPNLFLKNAK